MAPGARSSLALAWALALCGLVAGCGRGPEPGAAAEVARPAAADAGEVVVPPDSPQTARLRIGPVETAEIAPDQVVAPGRIVANPNRIARVLLPAPGRIVEVVAGLGSAVESGQTVVTLDSPDADGAVGQYRQAEAGVRQADAALAKARADVERAQDLFQVRAIAEKDLLSTRNDLVQAQGAAEVARAAVDQARRKLELLGLNASGDKQKVLVRAPINGKVLDVAVAPGEYRTDTTAPLMTVADLGTVWMASDVPEPSVRLIHVGDPVEISLLAYPGEAFSGRVARIADALDPQTRTVKVYVELANPGGRLRPEMFGTVRHAGVLKRMAVVPAGAIVQEYGRAIVFLERGPGRYERRPVSLGPVAGDRVAVLAGLQPGERVVVDGAILLKDR